MRPEKLIYTFVSYASNYNTSWGHGTALDGIERTAELAHKHGIPVTWIVNSGSVKLVGDKIRQWHEQYGDDVILQCPMYGQNPGGRLEELKQLITDEWNCIEEAFPWPKTKVIGRGQITNDLVKVLEELDFQGMWGYCWEQTWWDGITHRGIPWGFWYIDSDRYKLPNKGKGKIVSCEWTARDLNQTYHTGSPCVFSTDPNDVLRAGLCTGKDIEYWKNTFQDYLANTENNEYVFFLQQQEAHEMEYTDRFAVFPEEHVYECEGMLDLFFQYIKGFDITITSLPDAIALYHKSNCETAPSYMLTKDTLVRPEINEYTMTLGGVGLGPWPETFLYYDSECQMAFVQGENKPRLLRNYIGKWDMGDEFEEKVPYVFVTKYEKSQNQINIEYEIGHWKPIPFGLAYWDNLTGYEIISCEGVSEAKVIQDKLAFFRFNLTGEKTRINITLQLNR